MPSELSVNKFIAKLREYLELEQYISHQTKTEIFQLIDAHGEWSEIMNERSLIDDLLGQGMPADRPILRTYLSGRNIYQQAAKQAGKSIDKTKAEKMADYVVVSFGVLAELNEIMKPYTGSTVTIDVKDEEIGVRLHVWRQSLFCRNVRPRYESFFLNPGSPAAEYYKTHGWWGRVEDLDYEQRDMLNELADGFILIGRNPALMVKSQRKPRMSEADFLTEGQAATVALAKLGKLNLSVKVLAKEMGRDRETVKFCKTTYPDAWNKVHQKFTEAKAIFKQSRNS